MALKLFVWYFTPLLMAVDRWLSLFGETGRATGRSIFVIARDRAEFDEYAKLRPGETCVQTSPDAFLPDYTWDNFEVIDLAQIARLTEKVTTRNEDKA